MSTLLYPPLTACCWAAQNYELLVRGGYQRIGGFERYDGLSPGPTDSSYWLISFENGTAAISEGDIVDGNPSSASGKALIDAVVESGTYGGGDAAGYLILTDVTGTFTASDDLEVSASKKSEASSTAGDRGADNDTDDATWYQDAVETKRALIGKLGASDGSGQVRGLHVYNDAVYGFRDNAAGTQCLMWKATTAGWVQQSLGNRVAFTTGTAEFLEGETLTQTGTTATINRVVVQSGAFADNDAAGYLVIGAVTAGPYGAGPASSASGMATLTGAETANTIQPGGQYEFRNYNFYATSGTFRMYGVSGVDYAFEWDGTVYVPIITGNTNDKPTHLEVYEYHLFLAFEKGSLQNSVPGEPCEFDGARGSSENGAGFEITGMINEKSALAVFTQRRTFMLYGTSSDDFALKIVDPEAGSSEWSIQKVGVSHYLDDSGFTRLDAVQDYGNFKSAITSQVIEPLVNDKKDLLTTSVLVKKKNQYRAFFSDGTALYVTLDGDKVKGFMPVKFEDSDYSAIPVRCACQGKIGSEEVLFFGSDDGFVYQMDKGNSFDGDALVNFFRPVFSHQKSPTTIKDYLKILLEVESDDTVTLTFSADFDYSERGSDQYDYTIQSGGGYWNISNWNEFNWSTAIVGYLEGDLKGHGTNIAFLVYNESTYEAPHKISSALIHYRLRRRKR